MPTLTFKDCDFKGEKPDFNLQGRKINNYLNRANANSARKEDERLHGYKYSTSGTGKAFIGSISATFHKDKPHSKEDFLEKHLKRYPLAVTSAVKKLTRRLRELERISAELSGKKNLPPLRVNSKPNSILIEYIRYLISTTGYEGKRIEVELMTELSEGSYIPPSVGDEGKNIDGRHNNKTYSVKPKSWLDGKTRGSKNLSDDGAMAQLGVNHVVIYEEPHYDENTCIVSISYKVYDFTD